MSQEFKPNWHTDVPDPLHRLTVEDSLLQEYRQEIYDVTSASGTNWFNQQLTVFGKVDTFIDNVHMKLIGDIINFDE